MSYNFNSTETEKIITEFGQDFYAKILKDIETYSTLWKLSELQLIDYFSVNCLFTCKSELYGDCVLKICNNDLREVTREYNTLFEYSSNSSNNNYYCKIFDCDLPNNILLIERIIPGTLLKAEPDLEKRLSAFSALFNNLYFPSNNPEIYPEYTDMILNISDKIKDKPGFEDIKQYVIKAQSLCLELLKTYNRKMLIHGDLHYDNILLRKTQEKQEYIIIDPHGFTGDPIFDTGRYLSNEYWDYKNNGTIDIQLTRMDGITRTLEQKLNLPNEVMKKCFYIDITLIQSWELEDNNTPNYEELSFVERLLTI